MSPGHAVPKQNHDLNVALLASSRGEGEGARTGTGAWPWLSVPSLRLVVLSCGAMLTGGGTPPLSRFCNYKTGCSPDVRLLGHT